MLEDPPRVKCSCGREFPASEINPELGVGYGTTKSHHHGHDYYHSGFESKYDCQIFEIIKPLEWPEILCDHCIEGYLRAGYLSPVGSDGCSYFTCRKCRITYSTAADEILPISQEYILAPRRWQRWDSMYLTEPIVYGEANRKWEFEVTPVAPDADGPASQPEPDTPEWDWRDGAIRVYNLRTSFDGEYAWYREPPVWLKNLHSRFHYRSCQHCVGELEFIESWPETIPTLFMLKNNIDSSEWDLAYIKEDGPLGLEPEDPLVRQRHLVEAELEVRNAHIMRRQGLLRDKMLEELYEYFDRKK